MDERYCNLCERLVDLDEMRVVTEFDRTILVYDKTRGVVHDLCSVRATQNKLAKIGKVKGEIITLRNPKSALPTVSELRPAPVETVVTMPPNIANADPTSVHVIDPMMRGKVLVQTVPGVSPGQILAEDNFRYLFFQEDIREDSCGLQYLNLNETVEFQPGSTANGNRHAKRVNPIGRPEESRDHSYRDDAQITEWHSNNGTGFATRPTGESVFVHHDDVITEGKLGVGVWIRMKPCPPKDSTRWMWRAKEIEIYQQEVSAQANGETQC